MRRTARRALSAAPIILAILALTLVLAACGNLNKSALHISYSADENYGTGDYIYSTVTFSGSGMASEKTYSVKELEELAQDEDELAYEGEYSMLTRGAVFSAHEMSGVRLYEMLVHAGLDESTSDDTDVRIVSADGYVTVLSLGEIRQSTDNTYSSKDDSEPQTEGVPVILAFGSDGLPLTGPVGTKQPGEDVTEEEGYNEESANIGGPVRLIAGQKSADEYNAPDNAKWVREVIVGDDADSSTHTGKAASETCLAVKVTDEKGKLKNSADFTWKDIENFSETEANYYGEKNYYKGANLWSFLAASVDFSSQDGTVKLNFADGSSSEIDIDYFRNIKGDYSGYTNEKGGLTMTGLKPALGYSVNGEPSEDGLYALLPAAEGYVKKCTAKPVESVELRLSGDGELSENPYGSYKISFTGSGMEKETEMTVAEMESFADLRVSEGSYMGVSLAGILEEAGVSFDADKVTVTGTSEQTYTWDELDENRDSIFLITRENGKTPAKDGPVKLGDVGQITEISVSVKDGQWDHDKKPYSEFLDTKLTISGSAAKAKKTYTLEELENSDYVVKDTFGASSGVNGYRGVVLRKLIEENLKDGLDEPGNIKVVGEDGYETELAVSDVMNGIDSRYQQGEHRDVIIAFALNGEPLVKNEKSDGFTGENGFGPMRLVVENQISKWVKSVKEIKIGE